MKFLTLTWAMRGKFLTLIDANYDIGLNLEIEF